MKFPQAVPLVTLAGWIHAEFEGEAQALVTGMNEIHKVEPGDLSFVDHPKYYDRVLQSEATFILINKKVPCPKGKGVLFSDDPFRDFNAIGARFRTFVPAQQSIHPDAKIGAGTILQPGVFIGPNVVVGKDCVIHPNVTIYGHTTIGDGVIIHANTTIGADAFYFKRRKEERLQYDKLRTVGKVIIEDGVEIGAACTIDSGVSGATIIGAGSKLDNQVHVAHGAVLGNNCLIAAQVGIAGKTILEDEVILWGQVGVNKSLRIGRGAEVYAQSGVPKSIAGGKKYFGSPVQEARQKMKELAFLKHLQENYDRRGGASTE